MRVLAVGVLLFVCGVWAQHHPSFSRAPLLPIAPIAVYPQERVVVQGPLVTSISRPQVISSRPSSFRQSFESSSPDPCRPTPCGDNTHCTIGALGRAQCRCITDFVPRGNTINGCKPQCERDDDCPDAYRCQGQKCARVCTTGACGVNADCEARQHRAICRCPPNYRGNADINCVLEVPEIRVAPPAPPLDPCARNPCGTNAGCRARSDQAVCTCPLGYEGDPLTHCRKGECIENRDCPSNRVCQQLRCINPCADPDMCGRGAECNMKDQQPVCSCPRGFVGDPFQSCRRFDPEELCHPSPCGRNTNCKVRNERAVCSCFDNYIGNPLSGCEPECINDRDCVHNMACRNNICVNPCRNACGEGAYCDVRNSRAVCSCPEHYQGNPEHRCYAECTAHDDCPSYQACDELKCTDPCASACGPGADCKVTDHKPICSCPKGYTGHPFEGCRPFTKEDLCNPNPCGDGADCTPGFDNAGNDRPVCTCPRGYIGNALVRCDRGDCEVSSTCPESQACYAYLCINPCYHNGETVCGIDATCVVKDHQPVCSCPQGYTGNPLSECRRGFGSDRFVTGHTRK